MKSPVFLALVGLSAQLISGSAWCDEVLTADFLLGYGDKATVFASSSETSKADLPVFKVCNTTPKQVTRGIVEVVIYPQTPVGATHPLIRHITLERFACVFAQGGQIDVQTDPMIADGSLRVEIEGPHAASLRATATLAAQ